MARDAEGRAPYRRIADQVITDIKTGLLAPGDKAPSVATIMEAEGVSRATAARVLGVLVAEGYATTTPGIGTIVLERRILSAGATRLKRLAETGQPYAPRETSTDHRAERRPCMDPEIAARLGISVGDDVVVRERIFRQDGRPATASFSYIHLRALDDVPEILQQGQLKPWWQETYTKRTGKRINRLPQRFAARIASNDDLAALDIDPAGEAVALLVELNVFHDEEGPIEVWDDAYAPGFWEVEAK